MVEPRCRLAAHLYWLKNDWRSIPYRPLVKSIALIVTSRHVTDRPDQFLAILCHHAWNRYSFYRCHPNR